MSADDGRPLIDEKGRLFGAVNIIDALVVLFVVGILIGGVAFVALSEPEPDPNGEPSEEEQPTETELRYATLDLGTVSPQVAAQIDVEDAVRVDEGATLNVTDIHRTSTTDQMRVFVRVELEGHVTETDDGERFQFADAPPRIGRELTLETDRYRTAGEIQAVDSDGADLERTEVETVLSVTFSANALEAMSVGDVYTVGGDRVGTIESIEAYGTGQPDVRRAQIGVTYTTVAPIADVRPEIGTTTVREGATLPFETDRYEISGEIQRLGTTEPRGELATRSVTLELTGVSAAYAEQLSPGMTERVAGETIAELTEVTVTDGAERGNQTVRMTAELRVRDPTAGPRFKGEPLRAGDAVVLELDETTIRPTVIRR